MSKTVEANIFTNTKSPNNFVLISFSGMFPCRFQNCLALINTSLPRTINRVYKRETRTLVQWTDNVYENICRSEIFMKQGKICHQGCFDWLHRNERRIILHRKENLRRDLIWIFFYFYKGRDMIFELHRKGESKAKLSRTVEVNSMEIKQSNTAKNGSYEILNIFREKEVQSNTPFYGTLVALLVHTFFRNFSNISLFQCSNTFRSLYLIFTHF